MEDRGSRIADDRLTILCGDALEKLRELPNESVQCCVTSPPYWGLRDYGVAGQAGLEKTPEEYVDGMVGIFQEVRRVLKSNGTCWVNLGDSYANDLKWGGSTGGKHVKQLHGSPVGRGKRVTGLKSKDLIGIPWVVAFALRGDGWYLRSDIIWHKPNPMPESVTDRPTKSHEYLFLLTKEPSYFYNAVAIREKVTGTAHARGDGVNPKARYKTPDGWDTSKGDGGHGTFHKNGREAGKVGYEHKNKSDSRDEHGLKTSTRFGREPGWRAKIKQNESFSGAVNQLVDARNKRTVWTVPTSPFPEAHFATYPPDLIRPCILAGSVAGDIIMDPFAGSGTTGMVALELGRKAILIELNPEYVKLIERRCSTTLGFAF